MPVEDPTSGRLLIWFVSFFMFITVAAGGSLLLMYLILPDRPIKGLASCCWVAIGSGGGGAGGGRGRANVFNETGNAATDIGQSGNIEAQGDEAQDEFDHGPTITVEKNDSGGNGNTGIKRSSSSGNSINNMSFRSHESELPLAPSMAP
ncbi:hypothetical protein OIU84_006495 [Salix udensis]|uniref:Uncharacterized protein n=1 Tax=Salix udensis TaxID=889485 RepID=A0AAD6P2G3_9ROSI|nr:hypothetical protein OIU84_006495 [Salix udensis]